MQQELAEMFVLKDKDLTKFKYQQRVSRESTIQAT